MPAGRHLHWVTHAGCPTEWSVRLERCGGGFFHSPRGLAAAAPPGETLFAQLMLGDAVMGVAAAVWSSCRLSLRPRHVYFPTVPAVRWPEHRAEAVATLVTALRLRGAAEIVMDSFDARWRPEVASGEAEARYRLEYVVPLTAEPEVLARRCSEHHRRHVKRGEREGWTLRLLDGEDARALLAVVQRGAAARAAGRGDGFEVAVPHTALGPSDGGAHWGATTFSAWREDAPLCAALVGWANRRAFYVLGGSTPEGYACHAAAWLHWRIMCYLAEEGFTAYNLGGTPSSAALAGDPAHGLHRFKSGFGAEVEQCRGLRWMPRPSHARAHRVARWVATRLHA